MSVLHWRLFSRVLLGLAVIVMHAPAGAGAAANETCHVEYLDGPRVAQGTGPGVKFCARSFSAGYGFAALHWTDTSFADVQIYVSRTSDGQPLAYVFCTVDVEDTCEGGSATDTFTFYVNPRTLAGSPQLWFSWEHHEALTVTLHLGPKGLTGAAVGIGTFDFSTGTSGD